MEDLGVHRKGPGAVYLSTEHVRYQDFLQLLFHEPDHVIVEQTNLPHEAQKLSIFLLQLFLKASQTDQNISLFVLYQNPSIPSLLSTLHLSCPIPVNPAADSVVRCPAVANWPASTLAAH
jgi:hypothetical protein